MALSSPPGWYDDGSGKQRWWDGSQWTEQFQTTEPVSNGPVPLMEFVSNIDGKNATVCIYNDRVEYLREVGVSAGKITAGVLTGGMSLAVTGVGKGAYGAGGSRKHGSEVIPIKAVTSVSTRRDGLINTVISIATAGGVINMCGSRSRCSSSASVLHSSAEGYSQLRRFTHTRVTPRWVRRQITHGCAQGRIRAIDQRRGISEEFLSSRHRRPTMATGIPLRR